MGSGPKAAQATNATAATTTTVGTNQAATVSAGHATVIALGFEADYAAALGGTVCASRPVVDQGWLPTTRLVGKSGFRVKPKVKGGAKRLIKGKRQIDPLIKGTDFELLDWVGADAAPRQLADLLMDRGFARSRIGVQSGRIEFGCWSG